MGIHPAISGVLLGLASSLLPLGASADEAAAADATRYRVAWEGAAPSQAWDVHETRHVTLTVRNRSTTAWPDPGHAHPSGDGRNAVRLTYCWHGAPATDCRQARADLRAPLPAGEAAPITIRVRAPEQPGRYVLEFELVEELVAFFQDRGGATFKVEVMVRPHGGRPPLRDHALQVGGLLLLVIGVFFFCGFGVTNLLPGGRTSAASPFLMPFVGFGALSLVGHALAPLGPGTDTSFVGILIGFGALDLVAWTRGGRLRFSRHHLGAWAASLFAIALAAYPLVRTGYLTALGGEIDATVYVSRAAWMQEHGLLVWPDRTTTDFVKVAAYDNLVAGLRQGDQYALAFVSSVAGMRPHRLFSVLMAVFYGLMPLGTYVFARFGCRARRSASVLAAFLVAVQPLLHYIVLDSFLSQASSLGMFAVTACALTRVFRARGLRAVPLTALLVAALSTFYSVYAVLVIPLAGIGMGLRILGSRRGRARTLGAIAGRGLLLAVLTLAACPVGWWLTARGMQLINQISQGRDPSAQGNTFVYPPPGEIVGLVSHAAIVHELALQRPSRAFTWPMLALVAILIAAGLRAARGPGRLIGAGLLAYLAAAALHQRYVIADGRGFPYGYFKIAALASPFVLILFAQGVEWAVRRGRAWGGRSGLLLSTAGVGAAVAVGASSLYHLRAATSPLAYGRLALDWDALQLERARALIPSDEPLLVEDGTWPGRSWDLYLLRHGNQYDRGPVKWQPAPPEAASPRIIRRALLVGSSAEMNPRAGEPWFDAGRHEVIWSAGRYRLLIRRDGALADLRLAAELSTSEADPVRIGLDDERLSIETTTGSATQYLSSCASALELWFETRAAGSVQITQGGRSWPEALPVGAHAVRLPALATEVRLQSGVISIERVQALGAGRPSAATVPSRR